MTHDGAPEYDALVIGGGVVGSGLARDCAMRGLKTMLVEKRDFASGASGANMGMIHGGARYLLHDTHTTKISCIDSGRIQDIAPHLLFRIPVIMPALKGSHSIDLIETFFEAYDVYAPYKKGKRHTRLTKEEALSLEPGLPDDITGAITFDEWGINPFRLCVANSTSAAEHGATVMNHTEVVDIIKDSTGRVTGARLRRDGGAVFDVSARITVNACGAWAGKVAALAGADVKLRPGKGINIFFDRRISNYAVTAETVDGREVIMLPHESSTMLGCTDDDYYGDLDHLEATHDEVEYLFQAMERSFPSIRKHRIIRVMTGVRPTLFEWGKIEDKLTREHNIFDHETVENIPGFISVAGGKLATYRLMAEETADMVCSKLGVSAKCSTYEKPLPGGDIVPLAENVAKKYGIPMFAAKRLIYRHGSRCADVLEIAGESRNGKNIICGCEMVLEAEIRYAARHEWAADLDDLRRRTNLGCGPCQGARCVHAAAAVFADEKGLSAAEAGRLAADFIQKRWKGKYPILRGGHIAQEELNRAIHFTVGNAAEMGGLE